MNVTGGTENIWIFYDANRPFVIKYGDVDTYHYELNLQGDVIAILDSSGNRVVEYTYDAWGKLLSISGSMKDDLGLANPLRYRGYVYDDETGLYYCQSRYYDPEIGRFLNADAFASTGQGLLGNNMFAYCGNNPVNYEDPTGNAYQGIFRQINYNEHDHTYGGHRENFYAGSLWESDPDLVVADRMNISNGTVITQYLSPVQATEITNSYLIQTTQVMREYITENGMDHVSGSVTGVLFEWQVHNWGYIIGNGLSNIPVLSPMGKWLSAKAEDVAYGATIYDDNHPGLNIVMWACYVFSHPREAVQDFQIHVFE